MTTDDIRFMITLVLSVAVFQLIIFGIFIWLFYQTLNTRLEWIEKHIENLEAAVRLIKV